MTGVRVKSGSFSGTPLHRRGRHPAFFFSDTFPHHDLSLSLPDPSFSEAPASLYVVTSDKAERTTHPYPKD